MEYNQVRIELGALATGMFYAAQEERINAFNRIRQVIFRRLEGIDLTAKQDKKEEKDYEKKYTDKQLIKYIQDNKAKLNKQEEEYVEKIAELLEEARKKESQFKALMHYYIEKEPIYEKWLKNVKGISTLNTANLLQYFGYCEKAKHCSSLWKYAGLHVVDGKAPKKSKGAGQLDWNPKLRVLMYRIGNCFIQNRTPKYREIYDEEKKRQMKLGNYDEKKKKMLDKDKEGMPQSLLHADNRARRKMIKAFLQDYYNQSLLIRGIKPEPPYSARFHPNE